MLRIPPTKGNSGVAPFLKIATPAVVGEPLMDILYCDGFLVNETNKFDHEYVKLSKRTELTKQTA